MKLNYDVVETPPMGKPCQEILDEFMNSGKSVAEIIDSPKEWKVANLYKSIYDIIHRKGHPVKASVRKGRIFLIRE